MKFTGVRVEQYETLKIFRRAMDDTYRASIRELERRERAAVREAARRDVLRAEREAAALVAERIREAQIEAERVVRREAARVRKNLKAKERRAAVSATRIPVVLDFVHTVTGSDAFEEQALLESNVLQQINFANVQPTMVLIVSQGKEVVKQTLISSRDNDNTVAFYYNVLRKELILSGSDFSLSLFQYTPSGEPLSVGTRVRVAVLKADEIPAQNIVQYYRDGIDHCVLDPLITEWLKYWSDAETSSSRKRCSQIVHRLKEFKQLYPYGVPHDKMEDVAKTISRCIVLHNVIGGTITKFNSSSTKEISFTNTAKHHVERGHLTLYRTFDRVTRDEMTRIVQDHKDNKCFYHVSGDIKNDLPQSIMSIRGCWAIFNDDYDLFDEFNKAHGITDYAIDAVAQPSLNTFLRESRLINSAPTPLCDTPNDLDGVTHIDIEKAYTKHSSAPFYRGFVGAIQCWSKLCDVDVSFLKTHVGCYQYRVVRSTPLLELFGISSGCVYSSPSVEIEYFCSLGLTCELIAGAWGSTFDITYTPEMLQNKRYATWAGKLGSDRDMNVYTFTGDREWASQLKAELGDENVFFFSELNMIVVHTPKKCNKTKHHILAFITAYTRINMLEIIRQIPIENLVKVVLDGVYFRGVMPTLNVPVKVKEMVQHAGFRDAWYYPSTTDVSDWPEYNGRFVVPEGKVPNVCVLTGAGGTGKSYSVLKNPSFSKVLYVVPSHMLGRKCYEAYGVKYTTIHKLIGLKYKDTVVRPYKDENGVPAIVFIDEVTMMNAEWIETALEMYPTTFFFLAGDVDSKQWYQCRNGYIGNFSRVWKPSSHHHVVDYTEDHRCDKSEDGSKLVEMKRLLRSQMRTCFTDGGMEDTIAINRYIRSKYSVVSFDTACSMFSSNDTWIAGTHKTNTKLLEKGLHSRKLIETEKDVGSYTIHSFQGLTISSGLIFISLDMFEYAMMYTAISRGVRFSQIVFVS